MQTENCQLKTPPDPQAWRRHCDRMDRLWDLHSRATARLRVIAASPYYAIFENEAARRRDMARAEAVANRIYGFITQCICQARQDF